MFLRVKVYYNRDTHYTRESIVQIVGSVATQMSTTYALRDEDICTMVFDLLNGERAWSPVCTLLSPVAKRYGAEHLRSMRVGDLISVWMGAREDSCAEHSYEVTEFGYAPVVRELASV